MGIGVIIRQRFLHTEQKAWGGQQGRQGAGNAFLETAVGGLHRFHGQHGEALHAAVINRPPEGEGGETADDIGCQAATGGGIGRDARGRKEPVIIVRAGGVLRLQGPLHDHSA